MTELSVTNAREVGCRAVGIGSQRPRCNGLAWSKAGVRARLPAIAKNARSGERNGKSSSWLRWRLPRGPLLEVREKWGTYCSGVFARSRAWARGGPLLEMREKWGTRRGSSVRSELRAHPCAENAQGWGTHFRGCANGRVGRPLHVPGQKTRAMAPAPHLHLHLPLPIHTLLPVRAK